MVSTLLAVLLIGCRNTQTPEKMEYELRKLDLSSWEYRDKPEGTAKDFFAQERNRQKSRRWTDPGKTEVWTEKEFLAKTEAIARAIGLPQSGKIQLTDAQIQSLEKAEGQLVSVEGYLTLVYPGPKESVNGDLNFHDWHLELLAKPLGHYPQVGDPTPIIAEITPHTERKLFEDGVRLNSLAEWMRSEDRADNKPVVKPFKTQGAKAHRVRITGYLFWDYSHIGPGQVGPKVETGGAPSYHNPWRSTAWEIHPVLRIEDLGQ